MVTNNIRDFEECIFELELIDMPLQERKFTWFSGRFCSRLDKVMVEHPWLEVFPNLKA